MKNLVTILIFIIVFLSVFNSDLFAQLFEEKVDYYVGLRPNTVVSADFDNDGDIDLAASPNSTYNPDRIGSVTILNNNGDGTFFLADTMIVGYGPNLLAVNFDNDNDTDLVVSDWGSPYRIYLISNDGFGNFAITDSFPSYGTQAHLLCAADFDNDSNIDLAVPNSGSSNLGLFFNNGDGTFALPPPLLTVGSTPICAVSRDLDADGDSDLVVSLRGLGGIRVLLNDGTGNFPDGTFYQTGSSAFAHSLADYNSDGCLDVAVPNYASNTLSVMFGNCDGTFGSKIDYPGCQPILAASADFDNDGDIDIAVSNNGCNTVSIYINKGDGTFTPDYSLATGNGPVGITTNDLNGDGWVDLAVCNFDKLNSFNTFGNTVSVFINNQRTIIFPLNTKTDKNYLKTSGDSISITSNFENYYEHYFTASAIYTSSDGTSTDSIAFYDDGLHGDSLANDGLYGGFIPSISVEEFYNIRISTTDIQTNKYFLSGNLTRITTAGPVKIDSLLITYNPIPKTYTVKPFVRNAGQTFTVKNLQLNMSSDDSTITNISGMVSIDSLMPGEVLFTNGSFTVRIDTTNFSLPFRFKFTIKSDGQIFWRDSIDIATNVEDEKFQPLAFKLEQNYPNPFNPSTKLQYSIPKTSQVQIVVYDVLGNEIESLVNEEKPSGTYELTWNAKELPSGVYFYKLQAGTFVETKKMVLLK